MSVTECATACLLELVVHADDLAVSLDVAPPGFSAAGIDLAVGALVRISLRRHGQVAVVRMLARAQLAPLAGITAF
jgi:hypothetical protein